MHLYAVICVFAYLTNKVCYSYWESWNSWGSCSVSCGYGVQYRTRNCNCNNYNCIYWYCYCYGSEGYEKTDCFQTECPVNGKWACWATWSQCSTTCATGIRHRDRLCNNPSPAYGGITCPGNSSQTENCDLQPCPKEQPEISCYSPGVVAGVAIACIISTLICVVVIFVARKQLCAICHKNRTLELDHNQQHQSPSVNNPQYAGQDNVVGAMDAATSMDYNRIANRVQSTDDLEIYENMKI